MDNFPNALIANENIKGANIHRLLQLFSVEAGEIMSIICINKSSDSRNKQLKLV